MFLQINGITLEVGESEERLLVRISSLLGLPAGAVSSLEILRRSLDARRTRPPRFVYQVKLRVDVEDGWRCDLTALPSGIAVVEEQERMEERPPAAPTIPVFPRRPVDVGGGPAGLFAALTIAEKGVPVLLLERGGPISRRIEDVERFWERGILNPESNVGFGEGGAGTFSDGKLTSRVKNPHAATVKRILVECGAPSEILVDAHPHIGTDRLRAVVVNLRRRLIELGGEVRFDARVSDFLVQKGRIAGVVVNNSEEIATDSLILAIGQSADDTYRKLDSLDVAMTAKAFAVGLRVEHPQELINAIQYGRWAKLPELPPAEYFLTAKVAGMNRSVYSFCMCPGGSVVAGSVEAGGVVTNGMSLLARDSSRANSAVVVNVRTEDLKEGGSLAGLDFRRRWEAAAFHAGGADYCAPAQRLTDFLHAKRTSVGIGASYRPGVREAELSSVLPPFVAVALKRGFAEFERKMPGFITAEAILVGVETRTSSPVRILRGEDGQCHNMKGLYPCGEGAGYAGGIISSALDGMKAAGCVYASVSGKG